MKTHFIWSSVAIVALLIGTRIAKTEIRTVEKPVEVIRTKEVIVEKPVEVIKEVPVAVEKIVEKRVEVPAEITTEYKNAKLLYDGIMSAKTLTPKQSLADIDSIGVRIMLGDEIKKIISESDIRTKFEITLRRSGVPIAEDSRHLVGLSFSGFVNDGSTLVYTESVSFNEYGIYFRGTRVVNVMGELWRDSNYGTVGTLKARDALMKSAENLAEAFANDWLAMNPKK